MIKLFGKSRIINYDETLTVVRDNNVAFKDGKPVKQGSRSFEVKCSLQPMNGRDLLMVPEGDRFKEQYWLWTQNVKPFHKDLGLDIESDDRLIDSKDRVTRLGVNFEVQTVEEWGTYIKARIMRIDIGPNQTP